MAHVVVVHDDRLHAERLADEARCMIETFEQRWSRFLPESEVSDLNGADGTAVRVSPETTLLIRCAIEGWQRSRGAFDPTVLAAVEAAGYDRTIRAVVARPGLARDADPTPGCAGFDIDDQAHTVRLPRGVFFDPGGIAKGLAADLVVCALLTRGAVGACVSIGGDVRVSGDAPEGLGWVIEVEHPRTGTRPLGRVRLTSGAVVSSSVLARTWTPSNRHTPTHHIIDPHTGRPARTEVAGACVIARDAWLAEVLATAACVNGSALPIESAGACGLLIHRAGRVEPVGSVDAFFV